MFLTTLPTCPAIVVGSCTVLRLEDGVVAGKPIAPCIIDSEIGAVIRNIWVIDLIGGGIFCVISPASVLGIHGAIPRIGFGRHSPGTQ